MSGRFPMDLSDGDVADALDTPGLPNFLLDGRKLPTPCGITCCTPWPARAAIKAGWKTDDRELEALVKQVMEREDLKYCPHGRPICITLSKKQLEKQFKRS